MSDLVYVGFVMAGAVTLVIEAYRNFNAPNARHPFELHPILKVVEVRNLCTTGEVVGGFVFYALLYLVAYAVVLSSAEVYGLLLRAGSALGEIGAADGVVSASDDSISDILASSSGDYSKPIIVSALIISSLSIGAVKPIETTIRALAHRLAGVPRGVYRVIEHIRAADFMTIMKDHNTTLVAAFENSNTSFNEPQRQEIVGSLRAIDCLSVVANSQKLVRYFPLRNLERLSPLITEVSGDIKELRAAIDALPKNNYVGALPPPRPQSDPKKEEDFERKVETTLADVIAVFAVLYIRNDHAVYGQGSVGNEVIDPIKRLEKKIAAAEKQEQNAFGVSIVIAFVFSFLCATAIYYKWRYWQGIHSPEPYKLAPESMQAGLKDCATNFTLACEGFVLQWRQGEIRTILATVIWDQLQALSVTFFGVLLVILGREVRVEQQSWRMDWKFSQLPFLKLMAMSVLSSLAAVFLTALVLLAETWWDADFSLSRAQMTTFFQSNIRFILMQAFGGFVLALSALIVMDKHHDRSMAFTLFLAACGSVFYIFFTWASLIISVGHVPGPTAAYVSQTARDAVILSMLPTFFLFSFGYILEMSERGRKREK